MSFSIGIEREMSLLDFIIVAGLGNRFWVSVTRSDFWC